ncbi:hypothetical protein [Pedobacter aquatilis]|uniref:hypothetical protein n=1 Tax=Pedobacter aquatilis TaxID=351343 RepID=UPI00292EC332|nr:hypothetical protein [Pedobacter aquatilis]
MKLYVIILFLGCVSQHLLAQRKFDQDIQDSVIGWWSNNKYDHLKPQTDPVAKKKEAIVNDMVKWMKASYTPVGGLGTSARYINNQGYGVNFLVWNVSHDKIWTEPNGNFKPIPEENTKFYSAVNQLFGAFPVYFINTGNEFYFIFQPDGYTQTQQFKEQRAGSNPRIHPNAYPFVTVMNDWCTVYLVPGNKLPWKPVSKGELLQKAEEGLKKVLADKAKEVAAQNPNDKKAQDYMLNYFEKETISKYRTKIAQLRAKHASSLNEQAVVNNMQMDIYSFETDPDLFTILPFEQSLKHQYPVYKLDATTYAKMNDLQPQWVAFAFPFETKQRGNQLYELFTSMSQNINYDYIYNYFFDPEKIKGKAYTAANAAQLKERLAAYGSRKLDNAKKNAEKKKAMPANTVLFDDFSADEVGSKPSGWYFNSSGKAVSVSLAEGFEGHWLKLGYNNAISSTTLKTFPENFSLEYDILTAAFDGLWGANVSMEFSGNKKGSDGKLYNSSLRTSITAGNQKGLDEAHNYRGEVRVELVNTPSNMDYNNVGGYFVSAQPAFTNTKRKVHVQLVKKGSNITLSLNGKEIANSTTFKSKYGKDCGDCAIAPGIMYNNFKIKSLTQDADQTACYIGNIKITSL